MALNQKTKQGTPISLPERQQILALQNKQGLQVSVISDRGTTSQALGPSLELTPTREGEPGALMPSGSLFAYLHE